MISLVAYAILVSGLIGLAALLTERNLADFGWPRRGVWLLALIASLALPVISLLPQPIDETPAASVASASLDVMPAIAMTDIRSAISGVTADLWLTRINRHRIDAALVSLWIASSVGMLLILAFAASSLRRITHGTATTTIGNHRVVLSDRVGPAVIGFVRPAIILPRWLAVADSNLRALVIAHECEHVAARDQLTLLVALLLVAAMPWNPLLWWQFRRLRLAIEVDCDARVLRGDVDELAYSEALLYVRKHATSVPMGAIALTEPASQLERRIRIMLDNAGRPSLPRIGARLATVLIVAAAAWIIDAPFAQQDSTEDAAAEGQSGTPERRSVPALRVDLIEILIDAQECLESGDLACARARIDDARRFERDANDFETAQIWRFTAELALRHDQSDEAIDALEMVLAQQNIPLGLEVWAVRTLERLYHTTGQNPSRQEQLRQRLSEGLELTGGPSIEELDQYFFTSDYSQMVRAVPQYPPEAARRELEGSVVLQFTVTAAGTTEDIVVIESSSPVFEQAAIDAVAKYRYRPSRRDGRSVATPGVLTEVTFTLD